MDNLDEGRVLVEIDLELMPVVPEYLDSRRRDCGEIERLLCSGGMDSIKVIGHRMKGSGGSFGFDEISIIGEDLETAAGVSDIKGIRFAACRLQKYLDRVSVEYI